MREGQFLHTSDTYTAEARTLAGKYYTSPEIYAQEQERIFSRRWVCIGRADQIGRPGEYRLVELAGESLIQLRDQSGDARVFFNLCRHRGTLICEQEHGRFSHSIQCPYHAWTYALDGRLIGAPLMDDVPDFNKDDYPLHQVALAKWDGFLFVNLDPEAEPFVTAFSPLIGKFSRWNLAELRPLRSQIYDVQANWKLIVQNYSECYHCPLIHPDLAQRSPYRSGHNDLYDGPFLGGFMQIEDEYGSLTLSGSACALPLGEVAGADLERVYYYSIFPNMLLSLHPDYVMCHTIWPLATDRTRIVCEWLFDPAQQGRDGFDPDDAAGFWDQTNRQDWHVCELAQRGVSSRLYAPSPYSPAESLLAAFDLEYLRALA